MILRDSPAIIAIKEVLGKYAFSGWFHPSKQPWNVDTQGIFVKGMTWQHADKPGSLVLAERADYATFRLFQMEREDGINGEAVAVVDELTFDGILLFL